MRDEDFALMTYKKNYDSIGIYLKILFLQRPLLILLYLQLK